MIERDQLDLRIGDLLAELAPPTTPDYLAAVQARAHRDRQRPTWRFPGRWLPFDVPAFAPRPAHALLWVGVAALLILTLLVALAVGSQRRVPAPFGPAANGVFVYDDGSHLVLDELDGRRHQLPGVDPEQELRPSFSPDGTHLAFLRTTSSGTDLVVAAADGSSPRVVLTVDPGSGHAIAVEPPSWSPDSTRLAVTRYPTADPGFADIQVVPAAGGATTTFLPHGLGSVEMPAWSSEGTRLAFLGEPLDTPGTAHLYAAAIDGSGLTQLSTRTHSQALGYFGFPRWSPDGRWVAVQYGDAAKQRDVLILATDHLEERVVAGSTVDEAQPAWSPDGTELAFWRSFTTATGSRGWHPVVADLAGHERALDVLSSTADAMSWSPDGRSLVVDSCPSADECDLLQVDAFDPDAKPLKLAQVPPGSPDNESLDRAHWTWQRLAR